MRLLQPPSKSPYPNSDLALQQGILFYEQYQRYPTYQDIKLFDPPLTGNRCRSLFGGITGLRRTIYKALGPGYPNPDKRSYIKTSEFSCLRCDRYICTKEKRICETCRNTEAFTYECGEWMNNTVVTDCHVDIEEYIFD